ncbi:MAG: hypothetical protein HKN79_02650 [Flavobacteriales bacterium]|nr:hypothetical protein [Flavobacteriales bacterium]
MNQTVSEDIGLFFNAAFSIDLVLFTYHEGRIKVLLQKKEESGASQEMALIGQLIQPSEDTKQSLNRLAESRLGRSDFYRKQLRAFTELGRHPMGRVVTVAYYGLVTYDTIATDERLEWHDIYKAPPLSYDHDKILKVAIHRFKKGLLRHATVFEMLPKEFILKEVLDIYEVAFQEKLDAPNFRRQLMTSGLIKPVGELRAMKGQMGRRPQVYIFEKDKYSQKKKKINIGFHPIA